MANGSFENDTAADTSNVHRVLLRNEERAVMKRLFGYLVLVAIGLAVISFLAAPAVAFIGIRSAAQSHDIAGLQKLVDFDAVRASLRPQLTKRVQAQTPAPSILRDPFAAIKRQIETPLAVVTGPEPDQYLRPEALDALIRGEGRSSIDVKASLRPDKLKAPFAQPVFWSINRARLAVRSKEGGRTVFTLERRGPYEWKLVHIGLPPEVNSGVSSR